MKNLESRIFFQPRVGKNYLSGGVFGKRVMVLGESHYCDGQCADCGLIAKHKKCTRFTNDVVNDYLNKDRERERWMNSFVKFERSLVGHTTEWDDRNEIWDSVLFYNYLQVAMEKPRKAGSSEQYNQAANAFYDVIDKYMPQFIIAWGKRLWNSLPGGTRWHWDEPIVIDGYKVQKGYYTISSGDVAKIIAVYHPSCGYSWKWWNKVITKFLTNS